jgi:hypothetical protein
VQADKHFFAWMAAAPQALPEAHCGCELEVDMYQRIAVLYSPEKGIVQKHIYHSISNLHLTAKTRFRVKPGMTQESQRWRRRKRKRQRNRYQASERSDQGVLEGVRPLDE